MGLSPVTPNFTQNLQNYTPKSFWKRPEGPFGMVALVALILGGAYGFYIILPFLITMLTDTIHMVALAAILIAILWLVFNPTFRTAVSNLFKNIVRFFASWVVETDPIGILRNNLDDMKKAKVQPRPDAAALCRQRREACSAASRPNPTRSTISGTRPPRRSRWPPPPPTRWRRSGFAGRPNLPGTGGYADAGRQAASGS